VAEQLAGADVEDRLAASYPFLTMLATVTGGWLLTRQLAALENDEVDPDFRTMKTAAARFYLDQIVPEALGLQAAATAPAAILYAVPEEAFAAA
jgi:hypothetical protein